MRARSLRPNGGRGGLYRLTYYNSVTITHIVTRTIRVAINGPLLSPRKISPVFFKVLDAPCLRDCSYLNHIDCMSRKVLSARLPFACIRGATANLSSTSSVIYSLSAPCARFFENCKVPSSLLVPCVEELMSNMLLSTSFSASSRSHCKPPLLGLELFITNETVKEKLLTNFK